MVLHLNQKGIQPMAEVVLLVRQAVKMLWRVGTFVVMSRVMALSRVGAWRPNQLSSKKRVKMTPIPRTFVQWRIRNVGVA